VFVVVHRFRGHGIGELIKPIQPLRAGHGEQPRVRRIELFGKVGQLLHRLDPRRLVELAGGGHGGRGHRFAFAFELDMAIGDPCQDAVFRGRANPQFFEPLERGGAHPVTAHGVRGITERNRRQASRQ